MTSEWWRTAVDLPDLPALVRRRERRRHRRPRRHHQPPRRPARSSASTRSGSRPSSRRRRSDAGYDVADYCDVDPLFGTLADFDVMLAAAHARGIRVIIDLVPNHSSDEHAWFQAALAAAARQRRARAATSSATARARAATLPPNNWESVFGGPAWTRVARGRRHARPVVPAPLRHRRSPTSTGRTPRCARSSARILRFWLDRGVDGFRVDVAHGLIKADGLPDYTPPADGGSMGGGRGPSVPVLGPGRRARDLPRLARAARRVRRRARSCAAEAWVDPLRTRRELGAPRRDAPGVQLRLPRDAVGRRGAAHGHRRLARGVRRRRRARAPGCSRTTTSCATRRASR